MDLFAKLNDKQTLAVQNTEGYVRVIAGAGSGKTKLLVSRYAYLVKEYGIDSSNILCVTFTNKAAAEMKKRITNLIGPEYSTSLICTYHGFCARLIRENPEKLFLTKGFQIIDTYQQKTILEEIFQKYELKLDYANFQSILKKIVAKKQDLSYVPKMCKANKVQILSEIIDQDDKIIEDYLQRQKAIYSLDFTDLMSYALYLLQNDEEVRNKWQERLNKEVRRRSRAVGIFPSTESYLSLMTASLIEYSEDHLTGASYISAETLREQKIEWEKEQKAA